MYTKFLLAIVLIMVIRTGVRKLVERLIGNVEEFEVTMFVVGLSLTLFWIVSRVLLKEDFVSLWMALFLLALGIVMLIDKLFLSKTLSSRESKLK